MTPEPTTIRPYQGTRGFADVPTGRLVEALDEYKKLRDHPNTADGLRAYARSVIREIRFELKHRTSRKPVAA
jgi:hypothetical protein